MTPAQRIAAYQASVIDLVTSAIRNGAALTEIEVDFLGFTVVAAYRTEGRYWPADANGPAEYPEIQVKRSTVLCGAQEPWEVPFELFPESIQSDVYAAIRQEMDV